MNKLTYNISMAVALASVTAGSGIQWGPGVALMVFGVVLVALTVVSTWVAT